MKTFESLIFEPHFSMDGLQARMDFPNGYGISVVRFKLRPGIYGTYTDNENEWEVAVFKDGALCYDTHITSDVIGHCSNEEVTKIMQRIQELK